MKFKPNNFSQKSRREGGVFYLGNPDRRGGLVLQEIQVRGGVKKRPHLSGGGWIFSGITHFEKYPMPVTIESRPGKRCP